MRTIAAPDARPPHGHYSHAVEHAGTIYVSGVLGGSDTSGGIDAQAERCLDQLELILAAAGSSLGRVLKLTVFVTSLDDWGRVNDLCARRFGAHRPARIVVPCGPLRLGSLLELDAIAAAAD